MPRQQGATAALHAIQETVYGTAPGGNWRRMPILSCDLGPEQALIDANVIGIGTGRHPAQPFRDIRRVTGNIVVPVDENNIGIWLRLMMGAPVTTGSNPNFTHTYKAGATVANMPSSSIEVAYPEVPHFDILTGVKADTMEMEFSPTGAATASFGVVGRGSAINTTSGAGTPVSFTYAPFSRNMGAITRAGSALGNVTAATIRMTNNHDVVETIRNDLVIEGADPTLYAVTGQITVRFADTALITQARDNTAAAIELSYTLNANRSLTLRMANVVLSLAKTPIEGPGGVQAAFDFQAFFDATDATALVATLRNGTSAYTAAA
jgi:hypothetical protein